MTIVFVDIINRHTAVKHYDYNGSNAVLSPTVSVSTVCMHNEPRRKY